MSADGVASGAAFAALLTFLAALLFAAARWDRAATVASVIAAVLCVVLGVAVVVTL